MAHMVPFLNELDLQKIQSQAERTIYQVLRDKLADNVLVLHSLELVIQKEGAPPNDAEADFVIFDPTRGFLVIEVKGGGITYDGNDRKWCSLDRYGFAHEISDPFRQARNAKHEILRNLKSSKMWGPAGMPRIDIGHAVVFPDLLDVRALTGPDRPAALIGSKSSLTDIKSWLEGVYRYWSNDSLSRPMGAKGMAVVESVFCQKIQVNIPLALTIEREYQRQIELTERQARILRSLRHRHRASIAGGAGTGKTVIALQHAKSLALQGLQTLLVCYNRALADFLKRQVQDIPKLHAMSFHQLCDWRIRSVNASSNLDLLREAQLSYPSQSLFDVQLPYALARSSEFSDFRYEAIVVDEGQDFGDEYWMPIEMLLADEEDSPLFIFSDPNQSVYRTAASFPIHGAPFFLTENCRNTSHIHKVAYTYYSGDEVDPPDIEGAPPQLIEAITPEQQAKKIKMFVSDLIQNQKVASQEIAVLVFDDKKDLYYQAFQRGGNPAGAAWSFESLWVHSTVLVDTARRFKGLEASIIILCGLEHANLERDRELLYVSLSRARSRLFLAGSREMFELIVKERLP